MKVGRPKGSLDNRTRLNQAVFDVVSPESAYWVGFLMADGCINFPPGGWSPRISVGVAPRDKGHLYKFQRFLETNHPVNRCGHLRMLQAVSPRLVSALKRFGVRPRKTFMAEVVGLENDRDFWRGVFDGDGSIYWTKPNPKNGTYHSYPRVSLVGSKALLDQFVKFVGLGIPRRHGSIWKVSLTGTKAIPVLRRLYEDCCVALMRKLKKAKIAMAVQDSRVQLK